MDSSGNQYWRVKAYRLTSQGSWEDKGTGLICVDYLSNEGQYGLVVVAEDEAQTTLMVHQINNEDIYQRIGEGAFHHMQIRSCFDTSSCTGTIINWHDPDLGSDMAISFQDQAGCDYIWAQIQQKQKARNLPADSRGGPRRHATEVDYDQGVSSSRLVGVFDDMVPEALDAPGE